MRDGPGVDIPPKEVALGKAVCGIEDALIVSWMEGGMLREKDGRCRLCTLGGVWLASACTWLFADGDIGGFK